MTADDPQQDMSEREAEANALATYADRVAVLEGEVASLTQTLTLRSAALDRVTATNGTATARVRELEAENERLTADIDECWVPLYHGEVHERRQAEARAESAEAERDALQQQVANVQARAAEWRRRGSDGVPVRPSAIADAIDAALAATAVSSRPGMTVTEAVADALADHRENTGQITGGTPQEPQQADDPVQTDVNTWRQRAEAQKKRAVRLDARLRRMTVIARGRGDRLNKTYARVVSGPWWSIGGTNLVPVDEVMDALDHSQQEPVERITDANGDELERGADTDAQAAQQQDMSEREADANALATYADRVAVLEGEVASLTQTLKMRSAALDRVTATNGTATARVRELEAEVERLSQVDLEPSRQMLVADAQSEAAFQHDRAEYAWAEVERLKAQASQICENYGRDFETWKARAESAEAERDALQQRLANVQARHWEHRYQGSLHPLIECGSCGVPWPCPTVVALDAPAVSSRPGMTVTEAVADALADHRENTGQITGGTPQEPQQADEAKRPCCEHCQPDSGEETEYCDRTHSDPCMVCAARQPEPVERITDANGDELERGADTDAQTAQQQDSGEGPLRHQAHCPYPVYPCACAAQQQDRSDR